MMSEAHSARSAIIGSTPAMMDPPSLDPPPDGDYGRRAAGDAGTLATKLSLTADNPIADAAFGIDIHHVQRNRSGRGVNLRLCRWRWRAAARVEERDGHQCQRGVAVQAVARSPK